MASDDITHKERGEVRRTTSPDEDRKRIIKWFRERLDPIAEKLDANDEESDIWKSIKENNPVEVDKYELLHGEDSLDMPASTFYTRAGWRHVDATLESATYRDMCGRVEIDIIEYYRSDYHGGKEEETTEETGSLPDGPTANKKENDKPAEEVGPLA